jgi:hypothetical protein
MGQMDNHLPLNYLEFNEQHILKSAHHCPPAVFLPPIRMRDDLGDILFQMGKKVGAELGVQKGEFSTSLMRRWKDVDEYVMVDLWAHQENYEDIANYGNDIQEQYFQTSINAGKKLIEDKILKKLTVCRNLTTVCATRFPDHYFDFVYVDARHDYKAVLEDLRAWWPKVKRGGIFAGHDYTWQNEPYGAHSPGKQDWTKNFDGTVDTTGRVTRGAVDDFFSGVLGDMRGCPKQITITYREGAWNTWMVGK